MGVFTLERRIVPYELGVPVRVNGTPYDSREAERGRKRRLDVVRASALYR